jgi:uncharacterized membrane protein
MSGAARFARLAMAAGLAAGYAFLAHYTNTTARTAALGTAVALAPLIAAALSIAWHASHRKLMLSLCAVAGIALLAAWPALERHYSLLYWIEHAGTQTILCMAFARTLAPGREPMCTYFARMVHGSLTPPIARYSRQVTKAWVMFFAFMAMLSTALFFAASLHAWSLFANFFTAPLIGLMFVAEYIVRRRAHPDMEHAGILAGIQAFWKAPVR